MHPSNNDHSHANNPTAPSPHTRHDTTHQHPHITKTKVSAARTTYLLKVLVRVEALRDGVLELGQKLGFVPAVDDVVADVLRLLSYNSFVGVGAVSRSARRSVDLWGMIDVARKKPTRTTLNSITDGRTLMSFTMM